jgi:hypothetical protein
MLRNACLFVQLAAIASAVFAQPTSLTSAGDCETESVAAVMLLKNAENQGSTVDAVLARGPRGQSATMIDLADAEDPVVVHLAHVGEDLDDAGAVNSGTTPDATAMRSTLANVCSRAGSTEQFARAW